MEKIRNISPVGDLDVPGVGVIKAGDTADVPDDIGETLLRQTANFALAQPAQPESKDAP